MGSQEPCIYRVPSQLREVQPGAYMPRMLLIGPLNHSAKPKALQCKADTRFVEYQMMEDYKVTYEAAFRERPNGNAMLDDMLIIIKKEEDTIRASYAVSTAWIFPQKFVELIFKDSVFIVEFLIRMYQSDGNKIGDLIVDNPFYSNTITDDLTLLENQLPYRYLKSVLNPIICTFCDGFTLDQVILNLFSVNEVFKDTPEFNHFTDMFRCVYMESLGQPLSLDDLAVDMHNAYTLSSVGVGFKVPQDKNTSGRRTYSLKVIYQNDCLIMPSFPADESSNIILRNVIAYEQCHDQETAYTTNYIHFMNFLVTTEKDVEILASEGVLQTNGVGRSSIVLETVNNSGLGMLPSRKTQYRDVAVDLNTHFRSRRKNMYAKLTQVYFSDVWTATATIAAICLLLFTLAGTVASIFQAAGVGQSPSLLVNATPPKP